ncbi:hypothetical protein BX070DRAFT_235405 [Coemansia spiralis]|nr:hypothetical protein BX070DRAFT_235405 [Coemansia spiralis]
MQHAPEARVLVLLLLLLIRPRSLRISCCGAAVALSSSVVISAERFFSLTVIAIQMGEGIGTITKQAEYEYRGRGEGSCRQQQNEKESKEKVLEKKLRREIICKARVSNDYFGAQQSSGISLFQKGKIEKSQVGDWELTKFEYAENMLCYSFFIERQATVERGGYASRRRLKGRTSMSCSALSEDKRENKQKTKLCRARRASPSNRSYILENSKSEARKMP